MRSLPNRATCSQNGSGDFRIGLGLIVAQRSARPAHLSDALSAAPSAGESAASGAMLASLSDDEVLLVLQHVPERVLASISCVSRRMLVLACAERERRRKLTAMATARQRRAKRLEVERFENYAGDERVLRAVLRYMFHHAPAVGEYSTSLEHGRRRLITPPGGVCLLRLGVFRGNRGITMDERRADWMVDVLAIQESALRAIPFRGEPLGAAGAAIAVRQAQVPKLTVPAYTTLYGRVFKIFIRSGVMSAAYLGRIMDESDENDSG